MQVMIMKQAIITLLRRVSSLLAIRREERWGALGALVYVTLLNVMVVGRYFESFVRLSDNYHRLFVRGFHVSGFDPLTYAVVSSWNTEYNIYRHPLLAFMMYLPARVNGWLMELTGYNMAPVIVGGLMIGCGFYAFVFLCRTLHGLVGLRWADSWLLGTLCFSMAYVMLATCVPDHFMMSMMVLCLTLYVTGRRMQQGRPLRAWQTIVLFFLTAGISLNNGIKVLLADCVAGGRWFWRRRHIVWVCALPCVIIWGIARAEWYHYERPRYVARQQQQARVTAQRHERLARTFRDTTSLRDTAEQRRALGALITQQDSLRRAQRDRRTWRQHTGKPIAHGEFSQWTDITTPRWASIRENLLGESVMLHRDHLLEDSLTSRPVIVPYRSVWAYVPQAVLVVLFVAGIVCGRRSRLLWLALSWMAFDMLIHVVLGFGLNEVYIMTAHWAFVPVVAIGYGLKAAAGSGRARLYAGLRVTLLVLTLWLMGWNLTLLATYLLG